VSTDSTDSKVANVQVQELDQRNSKPKVVLGDSLYSNHVFLSAFLLVKQAFALVRLRCNLVFYEQPAPRVKGQKGRPAKHGAKFKLSAPSRSPDRNETFLLGEQTVRLQAWEGLHFKKLAGLVGAVLRVEFLRPDGSPRYQRPLWLFWTGPQSVSLQDLCLMYLWRFVIEHMFRFMKQHLGLNANQSTNLVSTDQWMWLCALAYWQLLLMREEVEVARPAWFPARTTSGKQTMTPGQVQRGALRFLLQLGTPRFVGQTCRKRNWTPKRLSSSTQKAVSVIKKAKITPKQAAIGA
jgi:hypothetical protein